MHSCVKKVQISFVCYVCNLRRGINVPTCTLNVLIWNCFMNDFITWVSRVQDWDGFVFWASEQNWNVWLIPLDFVDFSGMMVSCEDIFLGGDIPNFDSAISRAWSEDSDVGSIEGQTNYWISVASFFKFFGLVGKLFGLFCFSHKLATESQFRFNSFQDI